MQMLAQVVGWNSGYSHDSISECRSSNPHCGGCTLKQRYSPDYDSQQTLNIITMIWWPELRSFSLQLFVSCISSHMIGCFQLWTALPCWLHAVEWIWYATEKGKQLTSEGLVMFADHVGFRGCRSRDLSKRLASILDGHDCFFWSENI